MRTSTLRQMTALGTSGGLESRQGTTAFHLPPHTLIDAGTGVQTLDHEALALLDHVLLTHAHLDHVAALPLLIDSQFDMRAEQQRPLRVYALPEVLESLGQHLFNDHIWPDFTRLPSREKAVLRLVPVIPGQPVTLSQKPNDAIRVTPFLVSHGVPTCGYCLSDGTEQIAICGDTGLSKITIASLNDLGPLQRLIIECAYSNRADALAETCQHLTPKRLARLLDTLKTLPEELWITHLKPSQREHIIDELSQQLPACLKWTLPS